MHQLGLEIPLLSIASRLCVALCVNFRALLIKGKF